MKKVIAITFCLALVISPLLLSGCSGRAPEDTGGIAPSLEAAPDNLVDPSQETDASFLYDTSITDLQGTNSTISDGQTVQVQGEVIGDVRACDFDDDHKWLTLQEKTDDNSATMTIYCSNSLIKLIDTFGAYGKLGTTLQVRGTFNLSCKDHDGLTDIHVESGTKIASGNVATPEIKAESISGAIAIFLIGAALYAFYLHLYRKKVKLEREEDEEDGDDDD